MTDQEAHHGGQDRASATEKSHGDYRLEDLGPAHTTGAQPLD